LDELLVPVSDGDFGYTGNLSHFALGSSLATQIRSFRPFLFVALFQGGGSEERAHDRATHLDPSLNAFQKVPAKSQWSSRLIL